MTVYPCAGCGRVVVVSAVMCVDCERTLHPVPQVRPHFTFDPADALTAAVDATLIFDPGA
jgi:hypothetical protein